MAYFRRAWREGWLTAIKYGRVHNRCRNAVQKMFHQGRFPPHCVRYERTTHVIHGEAREVLVLLVRRGTPWPELFPRCPPQNRQLDYFYDQLTHPGDLI